MNSIKLNIPRIILLAVYTLALFVLAMAPFKAHGQDYDQKVVIGATLLGSHTFDKTDEVRGLGFEDPGTAGYGHLFFEYYPWEGVGLGFRKVDLFKEEEFFTFSGTLTVELEFSSPMLTLHWVPYVSPDKYSRFGLIVGTGNASYEAKAKINGTKIAGVSSTGKATLFSGYVDWGGEDFGARLGYGILQTKLDRAVDDYFPAYTYEADASGKFLYLDLRWAFE